MERSDFTRFFVLIMAAIALDHTLCISTLSSPIITFMDNTHSKHDIDVGAAWKPSDRFRIEYNAKKRRW